MDWNVVYLILHKPGHVLKLHEAINNVCLCVCMCVYVCGVCGVCALHVYYHLSHTLDAVGDFKFFKSCSDTFPNLFGLLSFSSLIIDK